MHHQGVLFGREAFGRVGVDFAWNFHVVKIGDSGALLAKTGILPCSVAVGAAQRQAGNMRRVGAAREVDDAN